MTRRPEVLRKTPELLSAYATRLFGECYKKNENGTHGPVEIKAARRCPRCRNETLYGTGTVMLHEPFIDDDGIRHAIMQSLSLLVKDDPQKARA